MNAHKSFFGNNTAADINRRMVAKCANMEAEIERLGKLNAALKHLLDMVATTIGTPVLPNGHVDTEAMAVELISMVKIRNSIITKEESHEAQVQ